MSPFKRTVRRSLELLASDIVDLHERVAELEEEVIRLRYQGKQVLERTDEVNNHRRDLPA